MKTVKIFDTTLRDGEQAPGKAIVGANAFAYESGIHQHGVLSKAETYEIMTPDLVGPCGDGEAGIVRVSTSAMGDAVARSVAEGV